MGIIDRNVMMGRASYLNLIVFFGSLVTAVLCLSICAHGYDELKPSYTKENSLSTIGCIFPLSGRYTDLGKRALRGVLTATDVFDTDGFRIVVSDIGEGNVTKLQGALEEMVLKDGVLVVFGPIPSGYISMLDTTLKSLQVPTIIFPLSEEVSVKNPYIIRFSYPVEKQASALAQYAVHDVKVRTFGVLYPRTPIGEYLKDAFVQSVKIEGGSVTYTGSYDLDLSNIAYELEWVKTLKPEALFIPDVATRSAAIISKLKEQIRAESFLFLGLSTWHSKRFIDSVGDAIDGIVLKVVFTDFFSPDSVRWLSFVSRFKTLFDEEPGSLEYQIYEGVRLIINIVEADQLHRREDLIKRLLALGEDFLFKVERKADDGVYIYPRPFILTLKNGRIISIK